jgi:hypothetical protein
MFVPTDGVITTGNCHGEHGRPPVLSLAEEDLILSISRAAGTAVLGS